MKVLLVNGSPHKDGETAAELKIIEKQLHMRGVDTFWFHLGTQPVRGCINCCKCMSTHRCTFQDDKCNELIEAMLRADGVIIGSPVYFAGPNGALTALLDRVFYAASNFGRLFAGKPAAAVVTCWRAGSTAALDRLYKYFSFSEMPIISSNYWNMTIETLGGSSHDSYGKQIMTQLGHNMADFLTK